jgi:hypothetical protein
MYSGERRNMLRSPALQGYIRDTHTRAQQGAVATAMHDRRGGAGGGGGSSNGKNGQTGRERKNSF